MLSIPELGAAIGEHAAVRRIRRMQPAGEVGAKLFPPTYPAEREGPPRAMCSSAADSTTGKSGAC